MLKHLGISLKDAILSRSDRTVASGRDVTDEIDTLLRALVIVIAVVTVSLLAASAIGSLTHWMLPANGLAPIDEPTREVLLALQSVISTLVVSLDGASSRHHATLNNLATGTHFNSIDTLACAVAASESCQTSVPQQLHHQINGNLVQTIDLLITMLETRDTPGFNEQSV